MDVTGVEQAYPDFLSNLLYYTTTGSSAQLREHIISYNSTVSFAYLGAKIVDLRRIGPYVFKVHGHTYHRTSHLQPIKSQAPQFSQLYVLDSTQATEILPSKGKTHYMQFWSNVSWLYGVNAYLKLHICVF